MDDAVLLYFAQFALSSFSNLSQCLIVHAEIEFATDGRHTTLYVYTYESESTNGNQCAV